MSYLSIPEALQTWTREDVADPFTADTVPAVGTEDGNLLNHRRLGMWLGNLTARVLLFGQGSTASNTTKGKLVQHPVPEVAFSTVTGSPFGLTRFGRPVPIKQAGSLAGYIIFGQPTDGVSAFTGAGVGYASSPISSWTAYPGVSTNTTIRAVAQDLTGAIWFVGGTSGLAHTVWRASAYPNPASAVTTNLASFTYDRVIDLWIDQWTGDLYAVLRTSATPEYRVVVATPAAGSITFSSVVVASGTPGIYRGMFSTKDRVIASFANTGYKKVSGTWSEDAAYSTYLRGPSLQLGGYMVGATPAVNGQPVVSYKLINTGAGSSLYLPRNPSIVHTSYSLWAVNLGGRLQLFQELDPPKSGPASVWTSGRWGPDVTDNRMVT